MRYAAIALAALIVTGCSTTQPRIVVQEVRVPVPVACRVDVGQAPTYPDTAEAIRGAANLFERAQLLLAGRELRIARERELGVALKGCTEPL